MTLVLSMCKMAERLARPYIEDQQKISALCDEVLDPSGTLLSLVRDEAMKLSRSPARQKAREVLDRLCRDPAVWATNGRPGPAKLQILEDEFTAAFAALALPS